MAYSWKLKGSLFETLSLRRSVSQKFDEAELQRLLEARLPPKVRGTLLSTEEIHHNEVERQWKVTLRRYLQAESWSVQQAESRILQHASWREQIMPWSINEDSVQEHLDAKKAYLQAPGEKGRPLLVVKARNHRPGGDISSLTRFIIYCIEAASQHCWGADNPDHKLWIMGDLDDLAFKHFDAAALRASFEVLQKHFPERAAGIIMYQAPSFFAGCWKVISVFIEPDTQKKVIFANRASAKKLLQESVGLDIVPKEYGGLAEATPVDVAVKQLRQQRAARDGSRDEVVMGGTLAQSQQERQKVDTVFTPAGGLPSTCHVCAGQECTCLKGEHTTLSVPA